MYQHPEALPLRVTLEGADGTPGGPTGEADAAPYSDADGSDDGTLVALLKGLFVKQEAVRALLAAAGVVVGAAAAGATDTTTSPVQIAGRDSGGGVRAIRTDTSGRPFVDGAYAEGGANVGTGIGVVLRGASTSSNMRGDAQGVLTQPFAFASSRWQYAGVTGGLTDTADAAVMAAGGAGVRNYLTGLQFHNTSATPSEIVVKDGATVIWRGMAPASMIHPAAIEFPVPLRGTANTALNVAMITTGTATRVSAQGFQGS